MPYSPEVLLVARMAKPLGDPDRIHILRYLLSEGTRSFTELQGEVRIHPKALLEHLRILTRCQLITSFTHNGKRTYACNEIEFERHMKIINDFLSSLK